VNINKDHSVYICPVCGEYNWSITPEPLKKCIICGSTGIKLIKNNRDRKRIEKIREKNTKDFLNSNIEYVPVHDIGYIIKDFTSKLLKFIKKNKIKKKDLPKLFGVRPYHVTKLFMGDTNISIDELKNMADSIGMEFKIEYKEVKL